MNANVKVRLVPDLSARNLPSADVLIATAWQTAEALADAPTRSGRKFYIVYDYEFFMTEPLTIRERMARTYRGDFTIVATSSAVWDTVEGCGGRAEAKIVCGLDFNSFGLDVLPENRTPLTLGFPMRATTFKGAIDAIKAASLLRERYGERLCVTAFGTNRMDLPEWINWLQYPSQPELRKFYNQQSVFLLPSHYEGWGLPAVEAMACGAALVTADNGGSRDYAFHEDTALVAPIKRPDLLAEGVARLFEDNSFRIKLAHSGHSFVQRFRWETAGQQLEDLLTKL